MTDIAIVPLTVEQIAEQLHSWSMPNQPADE